MVEQIRGNTVRKKSFAIPTALSVVAVSRRIVKRNFRSGKESGQENASKRALPPRFAGHNDARVNALVRPRLRPIHGEYRAELFILYPLSGKRTDPRRSRCPARKRLHTATLPHRSSSLLCISKGRRSRGRARTGEKRLVNKRDYDPPNCAQPGGEKKGRRKKGHNGASN